MLSDILFPSIIFVLGVVITIATSKYLRKYNSAMEALVKLGLILKVIIIVTTIISATSKYRKVHERDQDIESIPYIDLLYARKMSILLFTSSCTLLLLIFITIVKITLPIPVWIIISSYLLIVAAYQFTISYRFKHGFYGLNRYEAKELIEFVLKDRSNGSTPGGRPIYSMQLSEQPASINEGSAVPNVQS